MLFVKRAVQTAVFRIAAKARKRTPLRNCDNWASVKAKSYCYQWFDDWASVKAKSYCDQRSGSAQGRREQPVNCGTHRTGQSRVVSTTVFQLQLSDSYKAWNERCFVKGYRQAQGRREQPTCHSAHGTRQKPRVSAADNGAGEGARQPGARQFNYNFLIPTRLGTKECCEGKPGRAQGRRKRAAGRGKERERERGGGDDPGCGVQNRGKSQETNTAKG